MAGSKKRAAHWRRVFKQRLTLNGYRAEQYAAFFGAFGALWASAQTAIAAPLLIAASAGGFLYIASPDLLPALHRQNTHAGSITKLGAFVSGIAVIIAMEYLIRI